MTRLYLWHADLRTELKAVEKLTASITDPDSADTFKVFGDRLQDLVDQGPPSTATTVETSDLPWKSRPTLNDLKLRGFAGCPLDAPARSQLTVRSSMLVKVRPVLMRAPRPSFVVTNVTTTIVVNRPDGTEGELVLPLFRGSTFLDSASMPCLATFGAVVEAIAAVAFSQAMETARTAADYNEWDNIYRSRAQRLAVWHMETMADSQRPSRTLHEPRLPEDIFIRAPRVENRPRRRNKSA